MARVLIVFAHPGFQHSRINRRLLNYLPDKSEIVLHDLYERYPDFYINVKKEQQLLLDQDVIVFQHPFYWYSCPALLKEWMDRVLVRGFAYGKTGKALAGKTLISIITAGGREAAYDTEQGNQVTGSLLLLPFSKAAHLCEMNYLAPFVVFDTANLSDEKLSEIGQQYRFLLEALVDEKIKPNQSSNHAHINTMLSDMAKGD